MPTIFDNIETQLLPELRQTLQGARRADFCVGYFNLRGWGSLADLIEPMDGTDEACCRVLGGMNRAPEERMRVAQSVTARHEHQEYLDGPEKARRRLTAAARFKEQIEFGVPSAAA